MEALIGLLGVVLGWVLAEFTEYRRHGRELKSLKKALHSELEELLMWSRRVRITQEQGLMLTWHGQPPDSAPVTLPTHVYEAHFSTLAGHLSTEARIAINSIYSLVKQLNRDHDILWSLRGEVLKDPSRIHEVNAALQVAFCNGWHLEQQLQLYLSQPDKFTFSSIKPELADEIEKGALSTLGEIRTRAAALTPDKIRKRVS